MKKSIFIITIFFMCTFCACSKETQVMLEESETYLQESQFASVTETSVEVSSSESGSTIFVHVCGQVNAPAVYEFEKGARVVEAIEKAGGFMEDAATDYLNLAKELSDGEKIYVPDKEEAAGLKQIGRAHV